MSEAAPNAAIKGAGQPPCSELLAAIVASSGDAIISLDLDGNITAWNPAAQKLFGFTPQEAIGKSAAVLLWPAHLSQQAVETLHKVAREEGPFHYESQRQKKDGTLVEVSVTAFGVRNDADKLIGISAIYRDIGEHKQVQADREAHAYTRGLIESCLDAMLIVGGDLVITDINEQAGKLFRTTRDALIGSRFDSYFTDPGHAAQGIHRSLSEGYVSDYELALKPVNGKQILVSVNASVFRGAAGQIGGVFAVARDVTQQRELERELRQAQTYTRGLIESSLDAMLTVDRNLVIMDVNEQMAKMTEVPKSMLIGNRFDRCFTDPERAAAGVNETLKEGFVTNYDLAIHTPKWPGDSGLF